MGSKIDKTNPWYRDDDESILEIYDVETGTRSVLQEFDYLIEAPNWSPDGTFLTYNSNGVFSALTSKRKRALRFLQILSRTVIMTTCFLQTEPILR